jgi:hypothetical protein
MPDKNDRNEVSLHATTRDWLASDKKAINRWWWWWNKYPLSHALLAVVGLPFACFLMWYLATEHGSVPANAFKIAKMIGYTLLMWLAIVFAARVMLLEHLKHALSVRFTETAIELKNRFGNNTIMWSRVKRVLPTASNEYVVCTSDGDYYFPADQEWSASAAERLRVAASLPPANYSIVMSLDPKHKMTVLLMTIPVVFCAVAQFLGPFLHDKPTNVVFLLTTLMFTTPWVLIFALLYFIQVYKTPEVFLVGESILVVDQQGEHHINLDEVRKVWMIGDVAWISTAKGNWFVPATHTLEKDAPTNLPKMSKAKLKSLARKRAKQAMLALRPKRLRHL